MIASLISIKTIKQRRPRQSEEAAKLHNHAYEYCNKVERDGAAMVSHWGHNCIFDASRS